MTEEDYNALKEYDRLRYEYMLKYEPWKYYNEQIEKEWYRRYIEEELKEKELRKRGYNLPYPIIM